MLSGVVPAVVAAGGRPGMAAVVRAASRAGVRVRLPGLGGLVHGGPGGRLAGVRRDGEQVGPPGPGGGGEQPGGHGFEPAPGAPPPAADPGSPAWQRPRACGQRRSGLSGTDPVPHRGSRPDCPEPERRRGTPDVRRGPRSPRRAGADRRAPRGRQDLPRHRQTGQRHPRHPGRRFRGPHDRRRLSRRRTKDRPHPRGEKPRRPGGPRARDGQVVR